MMMDVRKSARTVLPILIMAACLATPALASTVEVGTCINGLTHFSKIQDAINASAVGGTIEVCPNTYPEQVTISFKLTLIGVTSNGSNAAIIVPPAGGLVQNGNDIFGSPVAPQILVTGAIGVTISHLTVDATGNNLAGCGAPTLEGIYFQNSSGTITDNSVRNQYQTDFAAYGGCQNGLAINVESTTNGNSVTISNNSVRAYQKNGITATGAGTGVGSVGPAVTIATNYIVGMGATAMNWPTGGAAENGVQVGFGATGKVSANTVIDDIWGPDTIGDTGDAASGILIYSSDGITISGNTVGSAQFGIAAVTDNVGFCTGNSGTVSCGPSDNTIITGNRVLGTQLFDAIDACSNGNTVESNTIFGSTQSGVHIDDSCTNATLGTISGNNNTVIKNVINEACAGVLTGTGTGNTFSPNTDFNLPNITLSGDVCPAGTGVRTGQAKKQRPSPYKPHRN